MKIEKLDSGSYRIRQQYKGKRYTVVVPYKPTQKEALKLLSDKMENNKPKENNVQGSFKEYSDKYIQLCIKKDLSPSTIRGYESIVRNISNDFKDMRFSDITEEDFQAECDRYGKTHSPKSYRSFYGYIRCVFKEYRPQFEFTIKLPPKQKKAEYEPSTKDIQRILEYATGSHYEIALRLCALAVRRGEVLAITSADISEDNVLTIDKDIVLNSDNEYVIKNKPKTADSYRRILIPSSLADMIREQGYAFKGNPHTINEYLHTVQDKLGIPRFRLHYMRHFAVAYLHKEGFTDQQIMTYGGWSNSSDVMKRAYRYNLDPEETQKQIADTFNNIF